MPVGWSSVLCRQPPQTLPTDRPIPSLPLLLSLPTQQRSVVMRHWSQATWLQIPWLCPCKLCVIWGSAS